MQWKVIVMKIMHNHANSRFDWLISGHQSVNLSKEAISILSGKYNKFTFVHPASNQAKTSIRQNSRRYIPWENALESPEFF